MASPSLVTPSLGATSHTDPGIATGYRVARPPRRSWREVEPRSIVMAVLFSGALALAWLILPGEAERIAMLERDGKGREALALLERRFDAGDRNQRTLFQMQLYYETFGELEKSRKMLEMMAELRPRDPQIHRRLAQFYKQTQDVEAQLGALRRQLDLRYSEPACKELVGLLRQRGQFNEEQVAIQQCREKGYRRAEDLIRLASLLAVDGDLPQAVSLLRSADDLRRLKAEPERLRLFGILLMLDQPRDALRRAIRWVRGARNEAFVDLLVDQLVLAKREDTALDLVRAVGTAGDAIALTAAELMLNRDQGEAARSYLRGWLEKARLGTSAIAGRFVRLAIDAGDPDNAFKGAQRFGLARLPQPDIASLSEALAEAGRTAEAEVARSFLRGDTLVRPPPVRPPSRRPGAAGRAPADQSSPDPGRELENWRLSLWTGLIGSARPTDQALEIGAGLPRSRLAAQGAKSKVAASVLRRLPRSVKGQKSAKGPRPAAGATPAAVPPSPSQSPFGSIFGLPK